MVITEGKLEAILSPIIARLIRLEEQLESQIIQTETPSVDVVDNLSDVVNPVNGAIAINRADNVTYYFSSAEGWIAT